MILTVLPLHDDTRSASIPWVNYGLILACAAAFLLEMTVPTAALPEFLDAFALVPVAVQADLSRGDWLGAVYPFFTSMFLHGGWMHILGNMLFLFIFGDNVEDRMGHLGYLAFYLLAGAGAGFAHVALNPDSAIPTLGASGAIAGVLGAYLVLFPHARVTSLVFLGFLITTLEVPALFFLGLWFAMQFLQGLSDAGVGAGVAWWAHVGGFVLGLLLVRLFDRGPRPGARPWRGPAALSGRRLSW